MISSGGRSGGSGVASVLRRRTLWSGGGVRGPGPGACARHGAISRNAAASAAIGGAEQLAEFWAALQRGPSMSRVARVAEERAQLDERYAGEFVIEHTF